jgi:hypothetical protein
MSGQLTSRNLYSSAGAALFVIAVLLFGDAGRAGQAAQADSAATLKALAWISGAWGGPRGRTQVEEHWTDIGGNMMLGVGRTMAGGQTVFFEFLRIEARADGVYYVAQPKGRPGTDFKLARHTESEAFFENPAHDFPKRIIYRRNSDGSLIARIDGGEGSPKNEEFHFRPLKK